VILAREESMHSDTLNHRTDALGAENFMDLTTMHNHQNFLQVGMKSPVCCPQREAPVVTKGCFFPAMFALSHLHILSRNKSHGNKTGINSKSYQQRVILP